MNIDLTPIMQAIITLLAALITYKLVPWIKAKTTNEQQVFLKATVKTLVFAAEQLYGAASGEEKLDFVIHELQKRGFNVDRAQIEATVNEYFGKIICENSIEAKEIIDIDDLSDAQLRALLIDVVGAPQSQVDECKTRDDLEKLLESYSEYKDKKPPTDGGAE